MAQKTQNMTDREISIELRRLREELGITQEEAARQIGCNSMTIHHTEYMTHQRISPLLRQALLKWIAAKKRKETKELQ